MIRSCGYRDTGGLGLGMKPATESGADLLMMNMAECLFDGDHCDPSFNKNIQTTINRDCSHHYDDGDLEDYYTGDEDDKEGDGDDDDDVEVDFDYYDNEDDDEEDIGEEVIAKQQAEKVDPEYFEYECWRMEDVDRWLNRAVDTVCKTTQVQLPRDLLKKLLNECEWKTQEVITQLQENPQKTLVDHRIMPSAVEEAVSPQSSMSCGVCFCSFEESVSLGGPCCHLFCQECWIHYLDTQIQNGVTTGLECMEHDCNILLSEDFVVRVLQNSKQCYSYKKRLLLKYTESHPELRFCPGVDCEVVVHASSPRAGRVQCFKCQSLTCFSCGQDYHAPNPCERMKDWIQKCSDDSQTANYLVAFTKECPKCKTAIEKNGGCNHMTCQKCRHDFCWLCLVAWNSHRNCNEYQGNGDSGNATTARESLHKYLFYYERYQEHENSLKLEDLARQGILKRINQKVMAEKGTWIDWQYLVDALELLQKCRYTLKYTYPFAYFLEEGPRKILFQYQQAQLETEVEELSYKMENSEITDKWAMAKQVDVAEKRRLTLLRDFLEVPSTRL